MIAGDKKIIGGKCMVKYMENESLDVAVGAIVEKELSEYKELLKRKISEHFSNPYCAKTDIGKVMYEKEIYDLIDKQVYETEKMDRTVPPPGH